MTPASANRRRIRFPRRLQVGRHAVLIIASLAFVLPLLWTLSASVQTDQQIYAGVQLLPRALHFGNYRTAWSQSSFSTYFGNSVFYTVTVVAGVVLLGSCAGYAFARMDFPFKRLIFYALLVFLTFPIPGAFIPLYVLLVQLDLVNTPIGYILPMISLNLPVTIYIMRGFFAQIPVELEQAAFLDGASRIAVFRRIAVPLARPAIGTVVILTALAVWNEFLLALVVFTDNSWMPIQVGLMTFQGTYFSRYSLMMAATIITTGPILLLYLIFQRSIIKGLMSGAIRG